MSKHVLKHACFQELNWFSGFSRIDPGNPVFWWLTHQILHFPILAILLLLLRALDQNEQHYHFHLFWEIFRHTLGPTSSSLFFQISLLPHFCADDEDIVIRLKVVIRWSPAIHRVHIFNIWILTALTFVGRKIGIKTHTLAENIG